jgi:glycosidase
MGLGAALLASAGCASTTPEPAAPEETASTASTMPAPETAGPVLIAETFRPPTEAMAAPRLPAWAQEAVWYQLFPTRFRNGDPSNDPDHASLDYPEIVPADSWTVRDWTGDWYARDAWEEEMGDDFYDRGVFHRRYGGDLQGVIDKLDYIRSLGVTAIYFNPVFYAPSLHKYDGASFHHIDPHFGPDPAGDLAMIEGETEDPATWTTTAADRLFFEMLREAKARGIRVVIDGVFNHTGTRFFAFEDVRENGQASRYADWYVIESWDDPSTPESEFDWAGWWDFKGLPIFRDNADTTDLAPGPKQYVLDATRRWMDPDGDGDPSDGIDGWRLDVADEVPTGFWADWNDLVFSINPDAVTITEVWHDASDFIEEGGFSASMNYHGFAMPVEEWLIDGDIGPSAFADTVAHRLSLYEPARQRTMQNLIDSHDTERVASMIVNRQFEGGYDRANSPRYTEGVSGRAPDAREREIQRMVATLQATFVGAPMVYYGTEAGMWGADDPDDRKPMVWPDLTYADECAEPDGSRRDPCDPVAFDDDTFSFYQGALALRKKFPALVWGDLDVLVADDRQNALAFARKHEGQELVVAMNRGDEPARLAMPNDDEGARRLVPVFASTGDVADIPSVVITLEEGRAPKHEIAVPAHTAVVYRRLPTEP